MDTIKTKDGKVIAMLAVSDYPLMFEVNTSEGSKKYITQKTRAGKICTVGYEAEKSACKVLTTQTN